MKICFEVCSDFVLPVVVYGVIALLDFGEYLFHSTAIKEKKKHVIAIKAYSLRRVARFDPDSYCLTAKFPPKNAVFNRKYVFLAAAFLFFCFTKKEYYSRRLAPSFVPFDQRSGTLVSSSQHAQPGTKTRGTKLEDLVQKCTTFYWLVSPLADFCVAFSFWPPQKVGCKLWAKCGNKCRTLINYRYSGPFYHRFCTKADNVFVFRMPSISKIDRCANRAIVALSSACQVYMVAFKFMTSELVLRARPHNTNSS